MLTGITLTPKKRCFKKKMSDDKKKIGEVERLKYLISAEGISYEELAELSEASLRTVQNTIYEGKPIGMKLLRGLQKKKGVSLDWLLLGEGEMIRQPAPVQNIGGSIHYGKDSTVVTTGVNNGNIVAEGGSNTNYNFQGGLGLRLCEFVRWWMESHDDPDDHVWLEKHLERSVPEYAAWKRGL